MKNVYRNQTLFTAVGLSVMVLGAIFSCASPVSQPLTLTISPVKAVLSDLESIALSCPDNSASIYYTLDGTDPTASSSKYASPLPVYALPSPCTIKAIALTNSDTSALVSLSFIADPSGTANRFGDVSSTSISALATDPSGYAFALYYKSSMFGAGSVWSSAAFTPEGKVASDADPHLSGNPLNRIGSDTLSSGGPYSGFAGDGLDARKALFNNPQGFAIDAQGNGFISDTANYRIRKISQSTGIITTVCGNGSSAFGGDGGLATVATLESPKSITIDQAGIIYVIDGLRIRKIDADGNITTLAGTGPGSGITPIAILINSAGTTLFVADASSKKVLKYLLGSSTVTVLASGFTPTGLGLSSTDDLYVGCGDTTEGKINKITPVGTITVLDPVIVPARDAADNTSINLLPNFTPQEFVVLPNGNLIADGSGTLIRIHP